MVAMVTSMAVLSYCWLGVNCGRRSEAPGSMVRVYLMLTFDPRGSVLYHYVTGIKSATNPPNKAPSPVQSLPKPLQRKAVIKQWPPDPQVVWGAAKGGGGGGGGDHRKAKAEFFILTHSSPIA